MGKIDATTVCMTMVQVGTILKLCYNKVWKDSITRKIGDILVAKSTCVNPRHSLQKKCETYLYAYANKLNKVPKCEIFDLLNFRDFYIRGLFRGAKFLTHMFSLFLRTNYFRVRQRNIFRQHSSQLFSKKDNNKI